ncbi:MAG TPA: hypothetical protein VI197_18490 [Polyangiaceae bacterium]
MLPRRRHRRHQRRARARRLLGTIRGLLADSAAVDWPARAEATLREVDASFDAASIPAELERERDVLVQRFGAAGPPAPAG